jgi:diguanylate cyclase (GGDEF)-like protein
MTSLVVTHDMASAYRIADTIAMIYEGKIVFCGTPAQIRATRNPYIQQFIRGQRKLHYAVSAAEDEGAALGRQVDVGELKARLTSDKRVFSHRTGDAGRQEVPAGLLNSAQFNEILSDEIEHSLNSGEPLALLIGAVDGLDDLSARHGADFGAAVLSETGQRLSKCIRGTDYAARLDNNDFALILTKTDPGNIRKTVEGIRNRISSLVVRTQKGENMPITLSFGVALVEETAADVETLIKNAGAASLEARQQGPNRIELYSA